MKRILLIFLTNFSLSAQFLIQAEIWNGTTSTPAKADKIEIFELTEEGIQLRKTIEEPTSYFEYPVSTINPYIIRAHYRDEFYGEMISNQEFQQKNIRKKVFVYETTKDLQGLDFHSGYQITKFDKNLEIQMIYVIKNQTNPPKSILPSEVEFYLPKNANILIATISYEKTKIPQRVEVQKKEESFVINRAFKPGNSELVVQVEIPEFHFEHQIDPIQNKIKKENQRIFRVIMWRPEELQPKVEGGTLEEKQIPNLGKAFFIYYDQSVVKMDFSQGPVIFKDPLKAYKNPIFDKPWKTTFALILGTLLIFLLIPIFAGLQIRVSKHA
ncbi:MAG: hypothetical protein NZ853_08615 [Leptospiraceae bacterium]|nr:hypothetical protein [Leptospiraceae bacterium]MDW7976762.1 hypothetical protein [Leptospiraceae bacterium]